MLSDTALRLTLADMFVGPFVMLWALPVFQ